MIAVLTNREQFTLVLMAGKNDDIGYPKDFHLGFIFCKPAEVDSPYQKLIDANAAEMKPLGK